MYFNFKIKNNFTLGRRRAVIVSKKSRDINAVGILELPPARRPGSYVYKYGYIFKKSRREIYEQTN